MTTQYTLSPSILIADTSQLSFPRLESSSGDCDCGDCDAFPSPPLSSYAELKTDSSVRYVTDFSEQPLDEEYSVFYSRGQTITVLNRAAMDIALLFTDPRSLHDIPSTLYNRWGEAQIQEILHRMIVYGLLRREGFPDVTPSSSGDTLSAWLHITDRCNLRCAYCYLPHLPTDMSLDIGRAAIDATIRSAKINGYRKIKLKYAGGEPLLCFSTVVELHRYAREQATDHDLMLDGVILSNGTRLNADIANTIRNLDLRLMISLDGMGAFHDAQRSYANGRGSFNDVINAVSLAIQYGLAPYISITVSGRTARGLKDVVALILSKDLPFSLNFYRENDYSTSQADLQIEEQSIIEGVLDAYKVIETNLPRRSLLASLVDRANLTSPHTHTCGAAHSYLVFDYRGRVAKCQMHIAHPVTNVNVIDPLSHLRADTEGIQNLPVDEKVGCRTCEWRYWCTGGCPLVTFRATGRYDVRSPNCNIYKALYPFAVRLEGLRLLTYFRS